MPATFSGKLVLNTTQVFDWHGTDTILAELRPVAAYAQPLQEETGSLLKVRRLRLKKRHAFYESIPRVPSAAILFYTLTRHRDLD